MVRVKSRYLLCEVNVTDRNSLLLLDDRAVISAVKDVVQRIHGDYGAALCSIGFSDLTCNLVASPACFHEDRTLNAILYDNTGKAITSPLRQASDGPSTRKKFQSALLKSIEARGKKIPCFLNCIYVGGTIRTCQKFLIRYNALQLRQMLPKCRSEEEKGNIQQAILDCCLTKTQANESEGALESEEDE